MIERVQIAVIGSGFSGSLTARILTSLGYDVLLLERGSHPRFAIGESTTPLANLSLERLACRYGLADCYHLAAHGRWLARHPEVRRGLKRGFTFYRHDAHAGPADERLARQRLLVAANPSDAVADTHWLRADVDHHFVKEAIASGVDYRDHVQITTVRLDAGGAAIAGTRDGAPFEVHADFVIDASGPASIVARQLGVTSCVDRMLTRSSVLFSHFENVALSRDTFAALPAGPYDDDWAAVHHIVDEGWMYSLRFDHGATSAGFVLRGDHPMTGSPDEMWHELLARYPAIAALFRNARPILPIVYRSRIQHRLAQAAGDRWLLLPHAYSFVDPLFSTGIAWALRAIERVALAFESKTLPTAAFSARYDATLSAEANQIDCIVAGSYEAMRDFQLFAAHAMIYFAAVSFAEVRQRLLSMPADSMAWSGFLGVGDEVLDPLPREGLARLRATRALDGNDYAAWVRGAIAPRNIGGFGEPERKHLYPVDLGLLVERHALLGIDRGQLIESLPALRGMSREPACLPNRAINHTFAS